MFQNCLKFHNIRTYVLRTWAVPTELALTVLTL